MIFLVSCYGRPESVHMVEAGADDCPACEYVNELVSDQLGVTFVSYVLEDAREAEPTLVRVEQVTEGGTLPRMLLCQQVSVEAADKELREESDA